MGLSVNIRKKFNGFSMDAVWSMENEIAALFGCSGAGKSLTLKSIVGLIRPDEGRIASDDEVLFDISKGIDLPPQKRRLGYVSQDLALFPHMSVRGNIEYGFHGMARPFAGKEKAKNPGEDIDQMLEAFGIEKLEHKRPHEISGGQKQRVALARALIGRPRALLLDEPFSGLDAPLRADMGRLVSEIRREFNIPVVLVTHDLAEARLLAGRLIVYHGGKVVQAGAPDEVIGSPACENVARLVSFR